MDCIACNSVGYVLGNMGLLHIWSDKNEKSPYLYAHWSCKKVWWRCADNIHEDYYRRISESSDADFRCPKCQWYKGEERIKEYLIINKILYEEQKKFDGLVGLGNGSLRYDFYLSQYNLLIEYQGNFHDGSVPNQTKENFAYQQEHDRRKREYAKEHSINLLEIWYWDFGNIEEILNKELKINNINNEVKMCLI
jgi:hypothetical protein